ncbi:hypothetical protein RQL62_17715 [Citrobacter amalonaticus]|nr:hypothetical protein [Citrobacter amalonaticus]
MTVSTEVDHNEYTGNGVTTTFPYTFRIFQKSDLVVQVVDLDENITVLVLDTDYTVTGAGGYTGGNVILATALSSGYQISISRELPVTQDTDLRNQGKFFAEVHEDAFDKLTMLVQQVRSWFSLALRKPSFVANYYDAMSNYIRNLRDPVRPQDAATKNYADSLFRRTLRVPEDFVDQLATAENRANTSLGFGPSGQPVYLVPSSGTAEDVMLKLSQYDGYKYIGECPDISTLRTIEPDRDSQTITLLQHTAGTGYGGGRFIGYLDGSSYTDDKGYIIKTSGGSVWLRQSDTEIKAVNFGYIVGDSTKAVSNAEAVVAAANYSFNKGGIVVLPKGTSYVDNIILDLPVTIKGAHPGSGASLVQREQSSDLVHTGNGYCFDFPPKVRPTIPTDTQPVTDGIRLMNLNIRGTNAGLGGIRINTAASIGIVGNERRNTTFMNINISGYYSGWGFEMFNTFTNHLQNVTVWDCAAPYYIRTAHSTDHVSCVYENCAWGCLAINTECNNHIGGTIEGIRYLTKMTQPVDYDENGNFPTDTGYVQLYAGIGMRTRGGTTNLNGVYLEANKIDLHLEDACKITMRDCYINALATRTDYTAIGTSGRLVVENCRFSGTPSRERWHPNSASLLCSHAIIIHNHYQNDASRPVSTPTISNVGEFDVYPGTPDTNAITRIWKGQGSYSSVNTSSATLTVDSDVTMAGLSLTVPTVTGRLYRDSNGFVKWKQ